MPNSLPDTVCFRVSRHCNACCSFCLAPADGTEVDEGTLKDRLDWLLSAGVKNIHFCGGEPTIHPALPALLRHVAAAGAASRITTNGLELSDDVMAALRVGGTHVKLSLHGDRSHHNKLIRCDGYDRAVRNLHRLQKAGIPLSVQTTLVAGGGWVPDWAIDFCLQQKVRRLSFLPFIARGRGAEVMERFALSMVERLSMRNLVKQKRRVLSNRLDVRWLDMSASRLYVVEVDGRILIERGNETSDQFVALIEPRVG
jgi:MoaA/NifB/PqqE/SkfB family radical SAM enzyme